MEVRCGHCNKLFRVSDDKITGTGIKFKCTKCGEYVKITMEDLQAHKPSSGAVPVPHAAASGPAKAPAAPSVPEPFREPAKTGAGFTGFDIIEDREPSEKGLPKKEGAPFLAAPHEFGAEALAGAPPQAAPPGQPASKPETKPKPMPAAPRKAEPAPSGQGPSPAAPSGKPSAPLKPVASPVIAPSPAHPDTVHPLVSGSAVGAAGGIGCAVPAVAMTVLGVGMLSALFKGKGGDLPVFQTAFMTGASLAGAGIVIGVALAMIQAKSDRNMFGVLGVLLGAFLGALFGALQGLIAAAGSGAVLGAVFILSSAFGWGVKALLVSIVVVIVRRTIMSSKREAFGTSFSGGQMMGVALAGVIVLLGVYGEVMSASKMKTATKAIQETFSAEGLQVTSSLASWDPANGDLLLNVTLENTTDAEKPTWYLVADVYDASGNVLVQAKMLNGKQLYTQRDYEVMAKRSMNVQDLKIKQAQERGKPIPAHGVINVEMRVLEPPAGIASFAAMFQPFDPAKILKEQIEDTVRHQQQQQR